MRGVYSTPSTSCPQAGGGRRHSTWNSCYLDLALTLKLFDCHLINTFMLLTQTDARGVHDGHMMVSLGTICSPHSMMNLVFLSSLFHIWVEIYLERRRTTGAHCIRVLTTNIMRDCVLFELTDRMLMMHSIHSDKERSGLSNEVR